MPRLTSDRRLQRHERRHSFTNSRQHSERVPAVPNAHERIRLQFDLGDGNSPRHQRKIRSPGSRPGEDCAATHVPEVNRRPGLYFA